MNGHFHTGIIQLTVTAIFVIAFINVARIAAAKAGKESGIVGTVGTSVGALVR
jgi:hypothetical protein